MPTEQKSADERVWDCATGVQNLLRNRASGRYYTRVMVDGRRRMQSLQTARWSIAKLRHADAMAKAQRQRRGVVRVGTGNGLMGDLLDRLLKDYEANTARADRSKQTLRSTIERLESHWQKCHGVELRAMKPSRITLDQARDFANYLHGQARHQQNKAKKSKFGYKASTVNTTLEVMHRVLRIGVESGALPAVPFDLNPVIGGPLRKPELQNKLRLPSSAQMKAVFIEMRRVPDAENLTEMRNYLVDRGAESAEFAELMAYSGARRGEAEVFDWADDLPDWIVVRGTKTATSRAREVPKIPALRELLERMRARRASIGRNVTGRVFTIKDCREGLEAACKRAGVERLTHHSLRHFFATICIEAGVDIPTISRWMGHADGGVLAMKTYGHLRREHSIAAAAKVSTA